MKFDNRIFVMFFIFSVLLLSVELKAQDYAAYPLPVYNPAAYDIAADERGNLHLLWMQGWTLYYGRVVFSGGGFTITGQQTVASGNINNWYTMPRIAVKRDGSEVHTVWGRDELWHAWRDSSGYWHTQKIGSAVTHYKYEAPVCAVRSDGSVHVIYQWWNDYGESVVPMPIMYLYKSGGKWSSPVAVSYNSRVAEYRDAHIFVDGQNGLHATWRGFSVPSAEYRYASAGQLLHNGSFYFLPYASDVRHNAFGDIYVDGGGVVHRTIATWTVRNSVTIDYSRRSPGSGFSSPTRPSAGDCADDHDHWAAVAATADGRFFVAYYDRFDAGYQEFILSIWNGYNWDRRVVDNQASASQSRKPSFATTYDNLFVIWNSRRSGQNQLWIGVLNNIQDDNSSLQITCPNGGEVFDPGQNVTISWDYKDLSGNVNLELYRGTVKTGNIAVNIPITQRSFSWRAGEFSGGVVPAGDSYRIRVVQVDGFKSDSSDGYFTIRGLDLLNPDGGEVWEQSKPNTIIWHGYGIGGSLTVSLFKGSQRLGTIAENIPVEQGSYLWNTGVYSGGIAGEGSDYRIRIEQQTGNFSDQSSGYFTIKTNYKFQLLSPCGGESWEQKSRHQISWDFENLTGNINIELYRYGVKIGDIASGIAIGSKSYLWNVGQVGNDYASAGGGYRVKINTTDGRASAMSEGDFTIAGISIFNPQLHENWDFGRFYTIRWESFGYGGGIDILLLKEGNVIGRIAESVPAADQSYLWRTGELLNGVAECGTDYKIKIVSTNGQFQSEAQGSFTINGIKLNSPRRSTVWQSGSEQRISWDSVNYNGKLNIYLFQNGRRVGLIAEKVEAATGSFEWKAGRIFYLKGISSYVSPGVYYLVLESYEGRFVLSGEEFAIER